MTTHREVKWVVDFGYAGAYPHTFTNEAEARADYERQASTPSYIRPEVMQPATLSKVVVITEIVEKNRD